MQYKISMQHKTLSVPSRLLTKTAVVGPWDELPDAPYTHGTPNILNVVMAQTIMAHPSRDTDWHSCVFFATDKHRILNSKNFVLSRLNGIRQAYLGRGRFASAIPIEQEAEKEEHSIGGILAFNRIRNQPIHIFDDREGEIHIYGNYTFPLSSLRYLIFLSEKDLRAFQDTLIRSEHGESLLNRMRDENVRFMIFNER